MKFTIKTSTFVIVSFICLFLSTFVESNQQLKSISTSEPKTAFVPSPASILVVHQYGSNFNLTWTEGEDAQETYILKNLTNDPSVYYDGGFYYNDWEAIAVVNDVSETYQNSISNLVLSYDISYIFAVAERNGNDFSVVSNVCPLFFSHTGSGYMNPLRLMSVDLNPTNFIVTVKPPIFGYQSLEIVGIEHRINGGTWISDIVHNVGLMNPSTQIQDTIGITLNLQLHDVFEVRVLGASVYANSLYSVFSYTEGVGIMVIPSAPLNLIATSLNGNIFLSWTTPKSDGGATMRGYKIYIGLSAGTENAYTGSSWDVDYGTNSKTIPSLTVGTRFFFNVTAINTVGESKMSNEANVTLINVPSQVINLQIVQNNGSVGLLWTPPYSGGSTLGINNYTISRGTSSYHETFLANTTYTTYIDKNHVNGQTYYYLVTASNENGNGSISTEVSIFTNSSVLQFNYSVLLPILPNPSSTGLLLLQWNPNTIANNYTIYADTSVITQSSILTNLVKIGETDKSTLSMIVNVNQNGTYYFVVVSYDIFFGAMNMSNCESVVIAIPPVQTISTSSSTNQFVLASTVLNPISKSGLNNGVCNITLTWNSVKNATNYAVYVYNGFITEVNSSVIQIFRSTKTICNIGNISAGTYYFVVLAFDDYNNVSLSNCESITISASESTFLGLNLTEWVIIIIVVAVIGILINLGGSKKGGKKHD